MEGRDQHERENKVVSKHLKRWGESGNSPCARDGKIQAKLKTLEEIRRQFEEEFIMIEGFELTTRQAGSKRRGNFPVHRMPST